MFNSLTEHWNGVKWKLIPSANMGPNYTAIIGGAAVNTNDVWAVGFWSNGSANLPYTMNWSGTVWSSVAAPTVGATGSILAGASAIPGTTDV